MIDRIMYENSLTLNRALQIEYFKFSFFREVYFLRFNMLETMCLNKRKSNNLGNH